MWVMLFHAGEVNNQIAQTNTITMGMQRRRRVAADRVRRQDAELTMVERRLVVACQRSKALSRARRLGMIL